MATRNSHNTYPADPVVNKGELPDLFGLPNGERISTEDEWPASKSTWRDNVVETAYGGLPPRPEAVHAEPLCHSTVRRWPGAPTL